MPSIIKVTYTGLALDGLMKLQVVCPEIYQNFVVQKTLCPFSSVALDQAHQQNNAIIKDDGTIGLLSPDSDTAFRRWEVAGPEVCMLLSEYD